MNDHFNNIEVAFRYRSNKELKMSKMLFSIIDSSVITKLGIALTRLSIALGLPLNAIFKKTLFRQFCGGTTLGEAGITAGKLRQYKVHSILDYGVEGKETDAEFEKTTNNLMDAEAYAASNKIPFISMKVTGIARFYLLEKVHQKIPLSTTEEQEWELVKARMDTICSKAAALGVMVLIDAEETWIQDAVNIITDDMMLKYNQSKPVVFNTFQLYCSGTLAFLQQSHKEAKSKGYILGAKLVRGAYMEKEQARAYKNNYPDPIQKDKLSTDKDFDAAVQYCLENIPGIGLFIGTHNETSCTLAVASMQALNIPANHPHVFFSQLYGMSDHISFNLANSGYNVAKYLPYGPVKDVIPYLLRRAEENSSIAGQSNRELALIKRELTRRSLIQSNA